MPDTIHEPARDVPVVHECDVCVVGGSCTGVFAALAARRLGASAAVIENLGMLGGTATASLVCIWHTLSDTTFGRRIIGGLTQEVIERLRARGAVLERKPTDSSHFVLGPTELALELDRMIVEAKVRPFLHTRCVAPVAGKDGRLDAVVIEDATGRRAVRARVFVDATGDAALVRRMGLPTYRAPALQPPTTCAVYQGLEALRERVPDFQLRGVVFDPSDPDALQPGFLWSAALPGDDLTMAAGTRVHGADCSDADELTAAEIEGRRQVRATLDILRRRWPQTPVHLAALPARIGIRQTRQARCAYELTERDVLAGRRFDDAIANGSYRVDVHFADGDGLVFRYLDGREDTVYADGRVDRGRWREPTDESPTFYQVPYRCLLPQGATNLLVAGRGLDADVGAFGAVRVMVNTNQTGQAAGVAAALALSDEARVDRVDPARLRHALADQGAVVI